MNAAPLSAAPAILTIDVAALVANWRLLKRRAAPDDCAAVVKANGYGLGIEAVAPPLYAAGCRAFFVAHIGEGQRLRALLPYADAHIYVLNGLEARAEVTALCPETTLTSRRAWLGAATASVIAS